MAIIDVENLVKKFTIPHERRDSVKESFVNIFKKRRKEVFNAVDDLSFSIEEGEFFGIIGRNGSGKSTLLKMLAGVYRPTSGNIRLGGTVAPFLELGVGFNPELSGRENVFLNGAILGLSRDQIREKYDDIVKFAELERFMDQKLKNYSSGMQVRLAFSVAMQADADILLLDEVLAVGDADFQRKCFDKFEEFKKAGKTILFVTHDLSTVRKFCDKVLYIKDGRKIVEGDTNDVIDEYIYSDKGIDVSYKFEDNEKGKGARRGNKKIEIKSVKFLDKFGKENGRFAGEDKMEIVVDYKVNEKVKDPIFGFEIYDEKNNYCFAANTHLRSISTKGIVENSVLRIVIEKIPFLEGKYFFTFAFSSKDFSEVYDWVEKGYSFVVENKTSDLGFVLTDVNFIIPK